MMQVATLTIKKTPDENRRKKTRILSDYKSLNSKNEQKHHTWEENALDAKKMPFSGIFYFFFWQA